MPTVSVSLSSLLDIVALAPSRIMDAGSAENFLSLLSASGQQDNAAAADQQPAPKNNNHNQNDNAPPAVAIDLPVPVVNDAAPVNPPAGQPAPAQVQTPPESNSTNNSPAANPASQAGNNSQNSNTPAPVQQSSNTQGPAAPSSPQTAPVNGANQTGSGSISQDEQQLRDQLAAQLAAIDQILLAIMQALSGAAATTTAPQTAGNTAPIANTTATIDASTMAVGSATPSPAPSIDTLLLQWQLQLQQAAAPQNDALASDASAAASNAPTTNASPMALLADMQALLQQLQQDLQPANGQNQPVPQNPLPLLAQLFQQPATTTNATAQTPVTPSPLDTLASQLKDSIAQARTSLQQLQSVNQSIYDRAQANLQAQLSSYSPSLKDALAGLTGSLLAKDTAALPAMPLADNSSSNVTSNTVPAVQNAPVIPVGALQFAVQPAVLLDASQNGAGGSGGNSSGGGQDQGLPQMILPALPGASQAAAGTGSASFATLLEQTSSGSLLDQVMFNIKTAVADGSSKIHIQLDPADLGHLDIRLDVGADGKTGVVITADNKNTLSLLQQDAQGLTRALSDAGLSTDSGSLSFNLGGQNPGQGQPTSQAALTYQKSQPDDPAAAPIDAVISRSYVLNLTQGLDITI